MAGAGGLLGGTVAMVRFVEPSWHTHPSAKAKASGLLRGTVVVRCARTSHLHCRSIATTHPHAGSDHNPNTARHDAAHRPSSGAQRGLGHGRCAGLSPMHWVLSAHHAFACSGQRCGSKAVCLHTFRAAQKGSDSREKSRHASLLPHSALAGRCALVVSIK